MSKAGRIGIVLALIVVVGAVMARKQKNACPLGVEERLALRPSFAPASAERESLDIDATKVHVPRLVDLGAGKCIPCKMMAPILAELKKDYAGRLDVEVIDIIENRKAAAEYDVGMIPTQIFYNTAGKELFRHEGFISREDILAKWKDLGVDLAPATAPA